MVLHAKLSPRVKETITGCAFNTKVFYVVTALKSTPPFTCSKLLLRPSH